MWIDQASSKPKTLYFMIKEEAICDFDGLKSV